MMHLPIHLPKEARLAGPVRYRWMYPIERYLLTLKRYVHNRSRPEGSIAKGYLAKECLTFCSRYLHDVETKLTHEDRNTDGVPIGVGLQHEEDHEILEKAHRYVLFNTKSVELYRR